MKIDALQSRFSRLVLPLTLSILSCPLAGADEVWEDISPSWLQSAAPTRIAFVPGESEWILLCTYGQGIIFSRTGGETWSRVYHDLCYGEPCLGVIVNDLLFNPGSPHQGVALTMDGSFWTDDGGAHWHQTFGSWDPLWGYMAVSTPDGQGAIASGLLGRMWTYDWANRLWQEPIEVHYGQALLGLAFAPGPSPVLFVGSQQSGIVASHTLTYYYPFNEGLPAGAARAVTADPEIPGRVLTHIGGELFLKPGDEAKAGREGQDRARIWWPHGEGLPATPFMDILHDPLDPNRVFAGFNGSGVYVSEDRGANWAPMTQAGMGHVVIIDIAINPDFPFDLLAAGHSGGSGEGGLYRMRISNPADLAAPADPTGLALTLDAFPNPFNPQTTVTFRAVESGRFRLSIYDMRGYQIVTLAAGEFPAGTHRITWNGQDESGRSLGSGTYLCRLEKEKGMSRSLRITLLK